LIFLAFCAFTALLTWPYVLHLRDAVVDPGDPYLISWILWWDYHQTFTEPLNLFQSNLFYPMRYTLAFSEHCYGIALAFFPLFALGVPPLTVQVVAMFLGFATSGYGAFRLGRTLTGSASVGWITGIAFAFVPFRFGLMSHLPYLFSMWIPLVFEALILFARERTRRRAVWFGVAFFMLGTDDCFVVHVFLGAARGLRRDSLDAVCHLEGRSVLAARDYRGGRGVDCSSSVHAAVLCSVDRRHRKASAGFYGFD
jgi:hypothetical protein